MSLSHPFAAPWERDHERALRWLALVLVAIGLLWRCSRYFLAFPIWGDEAFVLLNYRTRGYLDLFGPIDNCQIAPLLFHVAEMTVYRWLGSSELAVRLPAFLACLGSVALFWRLARITLPPLGHALAVGVFSVSIWPATMGALVKPYAFDLFFSLALLVTFVSWLRQPERVHWLVALIFLTPIAMMASYPSVFVGGAIGCVLLAVAVQRRELRLWGLLGLYSVALVGSFAAHYFFVAIPHMHSNFEDSTTAQKMGDYWSVAFPPRRLIAFPWWALMMHTGQMAAYPLGSASGGSTLTVALAIVGLIWMWRAGQRLFVGLVAATFGLWMTATLLGKYPYGASCRLSQHVAAFYCLLAGLGGAAVVLRLQGRWRATLTAATILGVIGLGGTVRDFVRPYRDRQAYDIRASCRELHASVGDDRLAVPYQFDQIEVVLDWYLGQLPGWLSPAESTRQVGETDESVWVVRFKAPWDESALVAGPHRRCVSRGSRIFRSNNNREPLLSYQWYHLVPSGGETRVHHRDTERTEEE